MRKFGTNVGKPRRKAKHSQTMVKSTNQVSNIIKLWHILSKRRKESCSNSFHFFPILSYPQRIMKEILLKLNWPLVQNQSPNLTPSTNPYRLMTPKKFMEVPWGYFHLFPNVLKIFQGATWENLGSTWANREERPNIAKPELKTIKHT